MSSSLTVQTTPKYLFICPQDVHLKSSCQSPLFSTHMSGGSIEPLQEDVAALGAGISHCL